MYHKMLTINSVDYYIEVNLEGNTDPGRDTEGNVGQLYYNKSSKTYFKCVSDNGGVYEWERLTEEIPEYAIQYDSSTGRLTLLVNGIANPDNSVMLPSFGSPLKAATVADMTDTTKVYVYTGSETGYTDGHWYYHNGTAWTDGGVYNSAAVVTDKTLLADGVPADAKVTGEKIADLKTQIDSAIQSETAEGVTVYIDNAANGQVQSLVIADGATKFFRTGKNLSGGDAWLNTGSGTVDLTNRTVSGGTKSSGMPHVGAVMPQQFKENTAYTLIITALTTNANGASALQLQYTDGTTTDIRGFTPNQKSTVRVVTDASKTLSTVARLSISGDKTFYVDECGLFEGEISIEEFTAYDGTIYNVVDNTTSEPVQLKNGFNALFASPSAQFSFTYPINVGIIVNEVNALQDAIAQLQNGLDEDLVSATKFSDTFAYSAGTYVNYNDGIYCFTSAHTGEWNAEHAEYIQPAKKYGLVEFSSDGVINGYPSGGVIISDSGTRTVYKRVYPGAKYIISRTVKSKRFQVEYTTAVPGIGTAYTSIVIDNAAASLAVVPPDGAKYLTVYCASSTESVSVDTIASGIKFTAVCDGDAAAMEAFYSNSDIVDIHSKDLAKVATLSIQRTNSENYARSPLKMLFFTDCHVGAGGESGRPLDRVKRAVELINGWGSEYIDVGINAGDTTATIYNADQLAQYDTYVDASDIPILNTIGNHDAYSTLTGARPLVAATTVYNGITAKVKENVPSIVQPTDAATNGLNYYYYDKGDFRIVVLDCMYWDADELTWFEGVLADAITNSKAVVAVTHYNFVSTAVEYVDSEWNPKNYNVGGGDTAMALEAAAAVKEFRDNGGTFIIWLTGHSHGDAIKKLASDYDTTGKGSQFQLICPSFANRASTVLKSSDPTQYNYDCLTYLTVDTYYHILKGLRIGANFGCTGIEYHTFAIDYVNGTFLGSCEVDDLKTQFDNIIDENDNLVDLTNIIKKSESASVSVNDGKVTVISGGVNSYIYIKLENIVSGVLYDFDVKIDDDYSLRGNPSINEIVDLSNLGQTIATSGAKENGIYHGTVTIDGTEYNTNAIYLVLSINYTPASVTLSPSVVEHQLHIKDNALSNNVFNAINDVSEIESVVNSITKLPDNIIDFTEITNTTGSTVSVNNGVISFTSGGVNGYINIPLKNVQIGTEYNVVVAMTGSLALRSVPKIYYRIDPTPSVNGTLVATMSALEDGKYTGTFMITADSGIPASSIYLVCNINYTPTSGSFAPTIAPNTGLEIANNKLSYPVQVELGIDGNPAHYTGREITAFNKIACIGDSITNGVFNYGNNQTVAISKYGYPAMLQKITGVTADNLGHGGYTSVEWYNEFGSTDFSGYDCAIIELGINDAIQSVSTADSTQALQNIIDKLQTDVSGIKIFIASITPAYSDGVTTFDDIDDVLQDLVDDNTNCYYLDFKQYSDVRKGTRYVYGHLTAEGYYKYADEIVAMISCIINNNPALFKNIQFIGTNYQM